MCTSARPCSSWRRFHPRTPNARRTQSPRPEKHAASPPSGYNGGMADPHLECGVLGPLQVTLDDAAVALGTPKQRAVLAMLVMNRNRPVSIDSLINAVWEQCPPAEARASLHTYISNLRRMIGRAGANSRSRLPTAPPGYQLILSDSDCDIGRFIIEKSSGVQAAAAGRFEQASRHLTAALAQWRGPVLEDLREFGFADVFATAVTEDRVETQIALAEAEIACGRSQAVINTLETLAAEHPYREPVWAQLITAYYLAERQSEALETYQRLKTALAEDLGIDPAPTVRALHQRVLRQEALDVARAATTTAVHAGRKLDIHTAVNASSAIASLRTADGLVYPLRTAATRIGRLPDNDIVLDDATVSRNHAVIIDTGSSFVISDLRSANGVQVGDTQIRGTASLNHGDRIRICDHEFTFEISAREDCGT